VLAALLHPKYCNISFNQVNTYGLVVKHSAAILNYGASQNTIYGNLVFDIPLGGVSYSSLNAGKVKKLMWKDY